MDCRIQEQGGREMKEGWEYSTIGKTCKTYSGGTPLKNVKEYYQDGNIPWLRSGEVCKKYISETELFITQKGLENSSAKYYPIDTVVVAMYGATAAQVGILKIEATSNQAVCGILPNSKFLPEFLYYFFCYRKNFLASQAQGGAQPNISQVKIKNLEIPVPPLSEQQSIVDYLDSAFAKIDVMKANAEKALNEATALFQASLKEMLEPKEGWEEKELKEICKVINGRAYSKDEMLKQGKYRLLRVGNFFTNDSWYYSDLELEEDKYCDNGDLLYAWSASFGPRIWDGEKVIYHYHIWKMVCSEKIDKYFMCYWLDSDKLKKQTMTNLHGATMAHITKGIIEAAHVRFPSLSEQQTIVDTLDSLKSKVDKLQENYDKISQECDALKQAILRQVFE